MKFHKTDEQFAKVFHEGYLKPTHYLTINEHEISKLEINMNSTTSNLFIGKRKHIEKLIKQIIHYKSESKEYYDPGEFYVITLWDNYKEKETYDIIMLATFESVNNYTIKLPLIYDLHPNKEVLILTKDNNINSSAMFALENLQHKYNENRIAEEELFTIKNLLVNNIDKKIMEDFKIFELEENNFYYK